MPAVSLPERRPYLFVTLLELTIIAVYLAAGTVGHVLHLDGLGLYALANAALCVILAAIVARLGWWRRIGFRRTTSAALLWVLPTLLPALLNVYPGLVPPGLGQAAGFLTLAMLVGFVEETAFRGLMLRALQPLGTWRAVLVTTVLFSLTHLMNVLAGEGGLQAALQLAYSAAIGFAFTAIVLRTGTIWPLVIAHGLIDFIAFLQDPALVLPVHVEIGIDVAVTVVFLAYGAFVLRTRPAPTRPVPAAEEGLAEPARRTS